MAWISWIYRSCKLVQVVTNLNGTCTLWKPHASSHDWSHFNVAFDEAMTGLRDWHVTERWRGWRIKAGFWIWIWIEVLFDFFFLRNAITELSLMAALWKLLLRGPPGTCRRGGCQTRQSSAEHWNVACMTCTVGSWNPWNPETHHVPKLLDRLGLRIITDHVEHLEIERVGFRQLMSSIVPQSWQRPERQATHRCTHVVISPTKRYCKWPHVVCLIALFAW